MVSEKVSVSTAMGPIVYQFRWRILGPSFSGHPMNGVSEFCHDRFSEHPNRLKHQAYVRNCVECAADHLNQSNGTKIL